MIFGAVFGLLLDVVSCYSCRVTSEQKANVVQSAMQHHPESDNQTINAQIQKDLADLATRLNAKFGSNVQISVNMQPFFAEGRYYQAFLPAHSIIIWRLDFYDKKNVAAAVYKMEIQHRGEMNA
jgi:hypothetical protein